VLFRTARQFFLQFNKRGKIMKRERIKTKINDIIEYWSARIYECSIGVDWSEAKSHCWRCGCKKMLDRCHIVPYSLKGTDSPDNLVLLCKRCHAENPNVKDKEIMWDWIKAYRVPDYETFWIIRGMQEYEFIYKKSPLQELLDLGLSSDKVDKAIKNIYKDFHEKTSTHFSQQYLNSATIAGLIRMMIKKLKSNV